SLNDKDGAGIRWHLDRALYRLTWIRGVIRHDGILLVGNPREAAMRAIWIGVLIAVSAVIGFAKVVYAQGTEFGKNEYVRSCAACHGVTGKGDGPVASSIKKSPADLTKLSEANKGVFPISRVYDVIDGRVEVMTHGTRDMPVWGEIYTRELISQF